MSKLPDWGNELPRDGLNRQIRELGESVVDRDGRLESGISHNNAEIEKLKSRLDRLARISFTTGFLILAVVAWRHVW